MASTRVTFTVAQKTADGKDRKAGTTASVPPAEARELIHTGRARLADEGDPKSADAPTQADSKADNTKKEKANG